MNLYLQNRRRSFAARALEWLRKGPEVRLEEMRAYGVLFALRSPRTNPVSVQLEHDLTGKSNLTELVRRVRLLLFYLKRHRARHRPDVWIVIFIDTRLERSRPNRVLRAQPEFQLHGLSGRESVEI
jgi:hypothetical protein